MNEHPAPDTLSHPAPDASHPAPGTQHSALHPAPGAQHEAPERDTPMTTTYVQVLVVQAAILVALWLFGRMFS